MHRYSKFFLKNTILLALLTLSQMSGAQLRKPECLKRRPLNGTFVVAHRGAHNGIPENSLPAYQKAIDMGCDFVEIDVRTTSDGKFVSIHNSKIDDYATGFKGRVNEMTFTDLRSLDIGLKTGPEWKGTRIPSFEEILELCHGKIGIYLDLKDAPVKKLVEIIKKKGMEREIIWYISASDVRDLNELKTSCPDCIPMPDPGNLNNIENIEDLFHPCIIATDMNELGEEFVTLAHKRGSMVICDDRNGTTAEWKQMIESKADGIQTDKPGELISYLKSLK